MEKIYFQDGDNYNICRDKVVKVTKYGVTEDIEIMDTSNQKNGLNKIEKISKDKYYDQKTNTTKSYKLNDDKSPESIKKSMKNLKRKLKNNFAGNGNELFVTLTTENIITDVDEMKYYFKQFWDKLKSLYEGLEYAYIIEQHSKRDGWHFHVLLKNMNNKKLYIPNSTIEALWDKGYTKTSKITSSPRYNNIDESAYLDSIGKGAFSTEETFGINKVISYMTKTCTKNKLPKGTRCYDTSRGLKSPKIERMVYSEICFDMNEHYQLNSEKTLLIRNTDDKAIINKIKTEIWKKIK